MKRTKVKSQIATPQAKRPFICALQLTDEQKAVVESVVTLSKPSQTLGGLAGTGKTTIVAFLVDRLRSFACCAYTGKAADVLRSKGVEATTIHSLIYVPQDEDSDKRSRSPVFIKKDSIPYDGIIVDEASMVPAALYSDLISFGIPIIFVGDHGQLEPVGEDIYLMNKPDFKLETVHRNAGDIALFAHHIRSGAAVRDFKESSLVSIVSKSDSVKHLLDADQIICARNETRVAINRYVRQLKGMVGDGPNIGDRVMSLQNSRRLGIFNGSQGIVRSVSPTRITICFSNGKTVKTGFSPNTFNQEKTLYDGMTHPFDFAYAVTCHKAQGSEWNKVVVIEQICPYWDHKRWAYTAASRAKKELIWVVPD